MLRDPSGGGASPPAAPSKADLRRAAILDAARTCFAVHGFHGTSMQQICAEAGMSPGALYRYFPSKDAIIAAIAEENQEQKTDALALLRGDGPIIDRFVACGMAYLADVRQGGCAPLELEVIAESGRNPDVAAQLRDVHEIIRTMMREEIRAAAGRGEIAPPADMETILLMLMSFADGIALHLRFGTTVGLPEIEVWMRRFSSDLLRPTGTPARAGEI